MRPATDPPCISTTDANEVSATPWGIQTIGLHEGIGRMFKWIPKAISCSDGSECFTQEPLEVASSYPRRSNDGADVTVPSTPPVR